MWWSCMQTKKLGDGQIKQQSGDYCMEREVDEILKQDGEMKLTWNKGKYHGEEWQMIDRGDREGNAFK